MKTWSLCLKSLIAHHCDPLYEQHSWFLCATSTNHSPLTMSLSKKHSRLSACAKLVYTPTSSIRASRKTTDSLALNLNWNNGGSISKWADYSHEGHCLCLRCRVNSPSFIAALVCYKMQLCCWSYQCRRGPFTAGTQLKLPSNANKSLFCLCLILCCCCRYYCLAGNVYFAFTYSSY